MPGAIPDSHEVLLPVLGENVDDTLEPSRQQMPKDQPKDYEITVPFLLNGEQWRPVNSIYSKVSLHFSYYFILRCIKIGRL